MWFSDFWHFFYKAVLVDASNLIQSCELSCGLFSQFEKVYLFYISIQWVSELLCVCVKFVRVTRRPCEDGPLLEEQETEGQRQLHGLLLQQLHTDVDIERSEQKKAVYMMSA